MNFAEHQGYCLLISNTSVSLPPPCHVKRPLAKKVQTQHRIVYAAVLPPSSDLIVFIPVSSLLWNLRTASGLAHDDAVHGKHRNSGLCA